MSSFIGNVNKLNANFGHLQVDVLSRLFKTYCCSFYGSQIWRINSLHYNKVCTGWNGGVKRMLNLPFRTHTWMLGPVLHQYHMYYQLQHRTVRFLHGMAHSCNHIVKTCFDHAMQNANTPIGHNLAFIRNSYGFNISEHTMSDCIRFSRPSNLCSQELFIVEELKSLLQSRDGSYHIDGFSNNDVSVLVALLCTM